MPAAAVSTEEAQHFRCQQEHRVDVSFSQRIITFSTTCWFHLISMQSRTCLQSTFKVCSNVTGFSLKALCTHVSSRHEGQLARSSRTLHTVWSQHLSGSPQDSSSTVLDTGLRGGEQAVFPGLFSPLTPKHHSPRASRTGLSLLILLVIPPLHWDIAYSIHHRHGTELILF